ncbi:MULTISPECIES: SCO family protein [unclassified Castellaniella]|uniref:SCO family protein n=1 Tax=unclassified Castellaniella TaxID=2617606 RepID=UPI0033155C8A
MRWVISLVVALAAGVGVLFGLTSGFTALTAETARRQDIQVHPREIPSARVLTDSGQQQSLRRLLHDDGRVAIVNFFYARCISLCLAQGSLTERLQNAIEAEGLQDKLRLISLSFDPRDDAQDLARYSVRMGANPKVWQFYTLEDPDQRKAILDLFGIVVVPAPLGEFEHNAAFHVVTPGGQLVRVVDLDDPGWALKAARSALAAAPGPITPATSSRGAGGQP